MPCTSIDLNLHTYSLNPNRICINDYDKRGEKSSCSRNFKYLKSTEKKKWTYLYIKFGFA